MILIFGATGLLGSSLIKFLDKKKIKFTTVGRKNSNIVGNILNYSFLKQTLKSTNPKIIINLVSNTNVDNCENFPKKAFNVNAFFVEKLNKILIKTKNNCYFIHFSTDQIYNGIGPHKENKNIHNINIYSKSKFDGEKKITYKKSIILRTNFFGKSLIKKDSFTDWIFKNLNNKKKIKLFYDIKFSPLSIKTICKILILVIKKKITGTYNLGSKNGMSKYEFGLKFAKTLNFKTNLLIKSSVNDKILKAKRPYDMTLNCKKIEKALNINLPSLNKEISLSIKEYSHEQKI